MAFATAGGRDAFESTESGVRNSFFSEALLRALKTEGHCASLTKLLEDVKAAVVHRAQIPGYFSNTGSLLLFPTAASLLIYGRAEVAAGADHVEVTAGVLVESAIARLWDEQVMVHK